jgi:hypothetical protein
MKFVVGKIEDWCRHGSLHAQICTTPQQVFIDVHLNLKAENGP